METFFYRATLSPAFEANLFKNHKILLAHAFLGILAFALLLPLGTILIRLTLPRLPLLNLHGLWQITTLLIYAIAFGLGLWLKDRIGSARLTHKWFDPHAYIGYILLGMLVVQPLLGYAHHVLFKTRFLALQAGEPHAKAPGRTVVTQCHLWLGRILVPLGIINGALGIKASWSKANPLQTVRKSKVAMIVYRVGAGVVYLIYLAVCVRHEYKRTMEVVSTEEGDAAAIEVATMRRERRQSLETGKEILKILGANANHDEAEVPLSAVTEQSHEEEGKRGERDGAEESWERKI